MKSADEKYADDCHEESDAIRRVLRANAERMSELGEISQAARRLVHVLRGVDLAAAPEAAAALDELRAVIQKWSAPAAATPGGEAQ